MYALSGPRQQMQENSMHLQIVWFKQDQMIRQQKENVDAIQHFVVSKTHILKQIV